MSVNEWLPARRRLLASFLAITIVPVALLVWLTWRIIDQDRALERQTMRDRMERSADMIVATLQQELAKLEALITASGDSLTNTLSNGDALVVSFAADRVTVGPPGRLLYYPAAVKAAVEPTDEIFQAGESLEFVRRDYPAAITEFRRLARSDDRVVRAAALLRLARVLYKDQQADKALATYSELTHLGNVSVDGTPAALIARDARCALLADLKRTEELTREAAALGVDLDAARWKMDRASYLFHADRVGRWLGTTTRFVGGRDTALALAGAVEELWTNWQSSRHGDPMPSGRRAARINEIPVWLVWRASGDSMTALIAGPRFTQRRLERAWLTNGVTVSLFDAAGYRQFGELNSTQGESVIRNAQETRLPWTLRVTTTGSAERSQLAARRRLLLGGLALTAMLTIIGGYFTARATARELAVARRESDFVSAVSHEFRTPLTSLRHLTELLESGAVASEERRRQYYTVMARETERLHRMVEGLLDFGRMEAGRREYSFEPVDPVELVEAVVDDFRMDIAPTERRIESIIAGFDANDHRVRVDREAISHAVRNLLDNAVKYSPDPSPVRVELGQVGQRVAIRVRDEGVGIAATERSAIFEKFVRGTASRALNVKGSGIGLAMARHIVRAHGGDITVESESGRGSTFTLLLPGVRDGAAAIA